jgi:fermentation-respiration switch protein FrsA (DUF1100 family)
MMKRLAKATLLGLFAAIVALWWAGHTLSAPLNHPVGLPPPELAAKTVEFDGVHGWFAPAERAQACVLLLHGVKGDRRSMIARAMFLKRIGYSSLLIDMQAHGETPGDDITFGYLESYNVKSAVKYLRDDRHCKKVAAIGQSMGGAASLLGSAPLEADALVLEAVYPTIEEATANRLEMRFGKIGAALAPLVYAQIPLRLDIPLSALRPIDAIGRVHCPVLVIGGGSDRHTPATETQRLYARAPGGKYLWLIEGAAHQDFYKFAGQAYEQKIAAFLTKHLAYKSTGLTGEAAYFER